MSAGRLGWVRVAGQVIVWALWKRQGASVVSFPGVVLRMLGRGGFYVGSHRPKLRNWPLAVTSGGSR